MIPTVARRVSRRWPGPTYLVRVEFQAPLEFVYRWCTDFTPEDAKYEGESFQRRILRRSRREVVYENLDQVGRGWWWSHYAVRLMPPNRWHADSVGSHRSLRLDYRLSPLPGDRTQLILTARRRPTALGPRNPSRAEWNRTVGGSWLKLKRSLERDFRRRPKGES